MTGTALVLTSLAPLVPMVCEWQSSNDAARIYAATQARRTAPNWAPRKGRIVDLAG